MKIHLPAIIRFDAIAATAAFLILYFGHDMLSPLSGLSPEWLGRLGLISAGYAVYGLCLIALKAYRPLPVGALIVANTVYSLFCVGLLLAKRSELTKFGIAHLLFDAVLVATLAFIEYRIARRTTRPNTIAAAGRT